MTSSSVTHIDARAAPRFHSQHPNAVVSIQVDGGDPWQVTVYVTGTRQQIREWAAAVLDATDHSLPPNSPSG
jgi:hypothetical protein